MKRNYIQPQVDTLALNVENAILEASNPKTHDSLPQVDNSENLFSAGHDSWGSESWNDGEE